MQEAVAAIQGIVSQMEQVSGVSVSITVAVEQQGAATAEIARSVQFTARGTEEVVVNVEDVRHAVANTGTVAGEVVGSVGELSR